jgi:hypothetical protein
VCEEVSALGSGEASEEFGDLAAKIGHGALGSFSEQSLELAKGLFNGVEIWRVLREVEQFRSDGFDSFGDTGDLVDAGIVHDDDVTGLKSWHQTLFDIGQEHLSVHRSIDHEGGDHSIVAQSCDKGHGLPMSVRHATDQSFAARAAAPGSHHVGADAGLIEKHQRSRIQQALSSDPTSARAGYISPGLLARVQSFF